MRALWKEMFDDLDPFGKFWLAVGCLALAAAAAMSFDFGWQVSTKHALFLAVLSIVAAFGPMAAEMIWTKRGRRGPALVIAAICAPLLAIEFYSHAGYTAGLRGSNIETATVQHTKWAGAQEAVSEDRTNLGMWTKRLAALEEQNAWVTTVTADALRAQLASANLAIVQESNRGGCGARCLARTQERDAIASKVALAEEKAELTKKIEATKRVLDNARGVAANTEHKSSAVAHQNESLRKWVALAFNGNTKASELQAEAAEQSANLAMAIAGTGLPAFAFFIAGLFRRREDEASPPAPETISPAIHTSTREIVRTDRAVWDDLRNGLKIRGALHSA